MIPIPYALYAVNFLAADVRNLFGTFVNVFPDGEAGARGGKRARV